MEKFRSITKVDYEQREINRKSVSGATNVTIEYFYMEQADEVFADKVREEKIRLEQTKKLGYETSLISDLRGVFRWEYEDTEGVVHGTRLIMNHVVLGNKICVGF